MKNRKHKLFGISQSRAVVYLLCHALILCIGISLMTISSLNRVVTNSNPTNANEEYGENTDSTDYTIDSLLFSVGTGMMATGICGLFTFGWVIYSDNEEEKRKQINTAASHMGLVNAFEKRSISISEEYSSRLSSARHNIDIIGFGLSALLNDHGDYFLEWSKHAKVRIILIDPDFPSVDNSLANLRDKEERNNCGSIRTDVCNFLKETKHLWGDPQINFDVKLATVLPSINMFRIDDEIFWGPYFLNSNKKIEKLLSRNLPTFLINKSGYLYDVLVEHFEAIWGDSDKSTLPREELWKK